MEQDMLKRVLDDTLASMQKQYAEKITKLEGSLVELQEQLAQRENILSGEREIVKNLTAELRSYRENNIIPKNSNNTDEASRAITKFAEDVKKQVEELARNAIQKIDPLPSSVIKFTLASVPQTAKSNVDEFQKFVEQKMKEDFPALPNVKNVSCGGGVLSQFSFVKNGFKIEKVFEPASMGLATVKPGSGTVYDLTSKIEVMECTGTGLGNDSISLTVKNVSRESIKLMIPKGAVFEQQSFTRKQNLAAQNEVFITLSPDEVKTVKFNGLCINHGFGSPSGNPMNFTPFMIAQTEQLSTQGKIWQYLATFGIK